MKNKFAVIGLFVSLFASLPAQAQEEKSNDNFATNKTEIISGLNKEKAIIDAAISCTNSATKREDEQKCREQKKSATDALKQERKASQEQRTGQKNTKSAPSKNQ